MALTLLGEHEREHERQHEQSAGGKLTSAEALHGPWAEGKGQRGQRTTGNWQTRPKRPWPPVAGLLLSKLNLPVDSGCQATSSSARGPLGQSRLTAHRGRPHRPDSRHGRTGQARPRSSVNYSNATVHVRSFVRSLTFMFMQSSPRLAVPPANARYTRSFRARFACSRRRNGRSLTWQCIALSSDWATRSSGLLLPVD